MGQSAAGRKIGLYIGAALRFFVGAIIGRLVFPLTIGTPLLIAPLLAERFHGDSVLALAIATGIGAVLSAGIGSVLGRRPEVDWWFLGGALLGPAFMLLSAIRGAMTGADAYGLIASGAYSIAGLALLLGFQSGRKRMAAEPSDSPEITQ